MGDQKEVSLSRPFIKELVSTILAFGNEGDRSQAIQLCAAAHFDITKLIDDTLTSTLAESTFAEESRETAHRLVGREEKQVRYSVENILGMQSAYLLS